MLEDDLPPPGRRGGADEQKIAAPVQSSEETLEMNMITKKKF